VGKASVTVLVGDVPLSPLNSGDSTYCSNMIPSDMTASANSGGILTWYSDSTVLDEIGIGTTAIPSYEKGTTMYYITETINGCEGLPSSIRITIEDCGIEMFTAFTPDNDGVNDKWLLPNIDTKFPNNVVTIYNRWGQLIFQSPQGKYTSSPWDGTYEGKSLPVDSYYYVIEYNDDYTTSSKGNVSIIIK
jgi:gliding motility-associated-like protein